MLLQSSTASCWKRLSLTLRWRWRWTCVVTLSAPTQSMSVVSSIHIFFQKIMSVEQSGSLDCFPKFRFFLFKKASNFAEVGIWLLKFWHMAAEILAPIFICLSLSTTSYHSACDETTVFLLRELKMDYNININVLLFLSLTGSAIATRSTDS